MDAKYMTKKQAVEVFEAEIKPSIPKDDKIMLAEEWNNFTDMLCKENAISQRAYETWVYP